MSTRLADLAPRLSDVEFRQFRELFRDHCGFDFGPESRYLLESRLARRLHELELDSFAAYHYHLRSDPDGDGELSRAVDELATNETYFLRERRQLDALIGEGIPALRARVGAERPLRIWSAGCSSGEEPYSIVLLALEAGLEPGRDLRVYASDISRRMLQRAAPTARPRSARPSRISASGTSPRRTARRASPTRSSATSTSST